MNGCKPTDSSLFDSRRNKRATAGGCSGITLIELVVVVVLVGILATIALRSAGTVVETGRLQETKQELDRLARAIVGNPDLHAGGVRSDFGYVGDVGALPANLDALVQNPGYASWNGPYFTPQTGRSGSDHRLNAWGLTYVYSGGTEIVSPAPDGGTAIVKRLASGGAGDLLANRVSGIVVDLDGTPPGSVHRDSVQVRLSYPNGVGGQTVATRRPDLGGYFSFDSIPVGNHDLQLIHDPTADTLKRFVTVLPASQTFAEYRLAADLWHSTETPLAGLVGYWRFDEGSGAVAGDVSGNGFDGDLQNMDPATDWVAGKIGGALDFDGSNDKVVVGYDAAFDLSDAFSVCGWFRMDPGDKNDYRSIVSKSQHWTNRNWWINVRGNGTVWWKLSSGGAQYSINPAGDVADNGWHHFAAVYESGTASLYRDGAVPAGGSLSGVPAVDVQNVPVEIGCERNVRYFKGQIDDIRIYDRALSAEEVEALYDLGN